MNKILLFLLALTFSISGFAQSICELEKERGIIEGMSGIYHPTQAFGPSYSGIPITSISTYSVEDTIVTEVDRVKIEDEYYYKNYISEWNKKTKEMSSSWKCWYEGYKTGKKTSHKDTSICEKIIKKGIADKKNGVNYISAEKYYGCYAKGLSIASIQIQKEIEEKQKIDNECGFLCFVISVVIIVLVLYLLRIIVIKIRDYAVYFIQEVLPPLAGFLVLVFIIKSVFFSQPGKTFNYICEFDNSTTNTPVNKVYRLKYRAGNYWTSKVWVNNLELSDSNAYEGHAEGRLTYSDGGYLEYMFNEHPARLFVTLFSYKNQEIWIAGYNCKQM